MNHSFANHRHLKHHRKIDFQGFQRDDGLWDLELQLLDTKMQDYYLWNGIRKAGDPIHDMRLQVTIDSSFNIITCNNQSLAVPYPETCLRTDHIYQALVGLNLMENFRKNVSQRIPKMSGCSHIYQLVMMLPVVAIQLFAGEVQELAFLPKNSPKNCPTGEPIIYPPQFQINQCAGLTTNNLVTSSYQWDVNTISPKESDNPR